MWDWVEGWHFEIFISRRISEPYRIRETWSGKTHSVHPVGFQLGFLHARDLKRWWWDRENRNPRDFNTLKRLIEIGYLWLISCSEDSNVRVCGFGFEGIDYLMGESINKNLINAVEEIQIFQKNGLHWEKVIKIMRNHWLFIALVQTLSTSHEMT